MRRGEVVTEHPNPVVIITFVIYKEILTINKKEVLFMVDFVSQS